jgi:hypothetical protein
MGRLCHLQGTGLGQGRAVDVLAERVRRDARTAVMLSHRATMYNAGPVDPNQRAAFHQQGFARMQQVITATNNLNAAASWSDTHAQPPHFREPTSRSPRSLAPHKGPLHFRSCS